MIGRPTHGVSRQWAVVVHYGMRRATGASILYCTGMRYNIAQALCWFCQLSRCWQNTSSV